MRKLLIPLALVVVVAGSMVALASGGTSRHAGKRASSAPARGIPRFARLATAKYVDRTWRRRRRTATGHHPDDPEHGLALPQPEGDAAST